MGMLVIISRMAVIAILVGIGIFLYKKGIIAESSTKTLSSLVVDVCNPALILSSVLGGNITAGRSDLIRAIIFGAIIYSILVILGFIYPHIVKVKKDDRRFQNLMIVYTNVGFIGIPVAKAVLPGNAMLYVVVSNIFYALLFYTHGVTILSNGKEKINLKKVFSPGTIMAVITLLVFWFEIDIPEVISGSVIYIGNATTFISMCMLGVAIARSDLSKSLKDIHIFIYIIFRMILFPLALAGIMLFIKADREMILAFAMLMSLPVGNLPLIQAEKTGEDTEMLSSYIMLTTIATFVTTTLVIYIVSIFLG